VSRPAAAGPTLACLKNVSSSTLPVLQSPCTAQGRTGWASGVVAVVAVPLAVAAVAVAVAVPVEWAAKRLFHGTSHNFAMHIRNMHAACEPSRRRGRARHLVIRAPPALMDILLLLIHSAANEASFRYARKQPGACKTRRAFLLSKKQYRLLVAPTGPIACCY